MSPVMDCSWPSRRFGSDKRMHPLPDPEAPAAGSTPVGLRTVQQWLSACSPADQAPGSQSANTLDHLYVVSRPGDAFAALLEKTLTLDDQALAPCTLLAATDAALGMGHSLASAVALMPPGALIIGLADMPWVRPATLSVLARKLRESPNNAILKPRYQGKSGNPLGFGPMHQAALEQCCGDEGARALVRHAQASGSLLDIDVDDSGILYDIDHPADLADAARNSAQAREVTREREK